MSLKLEIKVLRNLYFLVFFAALFAILAMHTFDRPILDFLRVPSFIQSVTPEYKSLSLYHLTLFFSLVLILFDAIALTVHATKFILKVSQISTIIGVLLMLITWGYFTYSLFVVDPQKMVTPFIFILIASFIIVLDLLTFDVDSKLLKGKN